MSNNLHGEKTLTSFWPHSLLVRFLHEHIHISTGSVTFCNSGCGWNILSIVHTFVCGNKIRKWYKPKILRKKCENADCVKYSVGIAIRMQRNFFIPFLSVVLNLIVVTAIKEKENSLDVFNVLLANLCLSNLTRYEVRLWLKVHHHVYARVNVERIWYILHPIRLKW